MWAQRASDLEPEGCHNSCRVFHDGVPIKGQAADSVDRSRIGLLGRLGGSRPGAVRVERMLG